MMTSFKEMDQNILNTLLATIYIPNFYELMQKFQENVLDRKKKK